jgi:hypothetical protein
MVDAGSDAERLRSLTGPAESNVKARKTGPLEIVSLARGAEQPKANDEAGHYGTGCHNENNPSSSRHPR